MNTQDHILAKGSFNMQVIDVASGNIIEQFEENNLVVTLGRTNIAKLLGGDAAGTKISQIGVGSNGTTQTIADTTLTDLFKKDVTSVAYPAVNSVRFSWTLESAEANGITLREFGLLNEDDVLCARKTRADIVKTSAVRLTGAWTLTIN